jgi:hypothetical protein
VHGHKRTGNRDHRQGTLKERGKCEWDRGWWAAQGEGRRAAGVGTTSDDLQSAGLIGHGCDRQYSPAGGDHQTRGQDTEANRTQTAKRVPQTGSNSKGGRLALLTEQHSTGCCRSKQGFVTTLHPSVSACSEHAEEGGTGAMTKIRGSALSTEREG